MPRTIARSRGRASDADTSSIVRLLDAGTSGSTWRIRSRIAAERLAGSTGERTTRYIVVVPSEPCAKGTYTSGSGAASREP